MTARIATSSWREHAECAKKPNRPEWWFPVGDTDDARDQTRKAKAACRRCPVIQQCGTEALLTGVSDGIWGGLSENELKMLRRELTIRRNEAAR